MDVVYVVGAGISLGLKVGGTGEGEQAGGRVEREEGIVSAARGHRQAVGQAAPVFGFAIGIGRIHVGHAGLVLRGIHGGGRAAGDYRRVVGARDGDRHHLVVGGACGRVRGPKRVRQHQRLAGRQVIERLRTTVEHPRDRARRAGSVDHRVGPHAHHSQQRRADPVVVARHRDRDHRGIHRVARIQILHRQRVADHQSGVGLRQRFRRRVTAAHRDHRRIVDARDRDGHGRRVFGRIGIAEGVRETVRVRFTDRERFELTVRVVAERPVGIDGQQGS